MFGGRAVPGTDWLGLAVGGFFLVMALAAAVLTTRFFFRRWGSLAALGYVAAFWALIGGALALVAGGRPNWQSLMAVGICVLANAGYGVYLEVRRKDLRITPEQKAAASAPKASMRSCPQCGLSIDARMKKCPMCGSSAEKA
ncbi:MAG TPA: hypothetical protein PK280_07250 [Planctomycetota bacterium]|nr:hypothetical protein [Planctomycetota bacterium]